MLEPHKRLQNSLSCFQKRAIDPALEPEAAAAAAAAGGGWAGEPIYTQRP